MSVAGKISALQCCRKYCFNCMTVSKQGTFLTLHTVGVVPVFVGFFQHMASPAIFFSDNVSKNSCIFKTEKGVHADFITKLCFEICSILVL